MTRHHAVTAQLQTPAQQMVEFQIAVALDAGVGGGAAFVAADEIADDLFVEIVGEIEYIVTHAQTGGHLAGVFHIVQGAAGAADLGTDIGVVKKTHGGAGAVVAGVQGEVSGHGTVHAAAHGDQGFLLVHNALLGKLMIGVYQ